MQTRSKNSFVALLALCLMAAAVVLAAAAPASAGRGDSLKPADADRVSTAVEKPTDDSSRHIGGLNIVIGGVTYACSDFENFEEFQEFIDNHHPAYSDTATNHWKKCFMDDDTFDDSLNR